MLTRTVLAFSLAALVVFSVLVVMVSVMMTMIVTFATVFLLVHHAVDKS